MSNVSVFSHYQKKYCNPEFAQEIVLSFCPKIIVVIPCFDEGDISEVLNSVMDSYDFHPLPTCVIVVINAPENSPQQILLNNLISKSCIENQEIKSKIRPELGFIAVVKNNLPEKDAGVGMARKIGMDIAVSIFLKWEKDGVIACLDADSLCQPNYLYALEEAFRINKDWDAASIFFEHPLDSNQYSPGIISAIIQYELHLRVFVDFQRWLGLPFAMQTIGSSMAVRATSYCLQGGMNKRKAGEDFYFLHKMGDKGKVGLITSTVVIPSPRISHRVPFGTGKAVGNVVNNDEQIMTYNPDTFKELKLLIDRVNDLYTKGWSKVKADLPYKVIEYFDSINIESFIVECKRNSPNVDTFCKRFFQWFNAFKLMKYCHYCREKGFDDVTPLEGFHELNAVLGKIICQDYELEPLMALHFMRIYDKSGI